MTIKIGDALPQVTLRVMTENGPAPKTTDDIFAGKKMVLFGVPGAFTPTCHSKHLPGYLENLAAFQKYGVQEIAVVSVNDPFVMNAWAKESGGKDKITFLSDGNAEFAKATGLDFDGSPFGLATRSKRFSMLLENGVVKFLNVEDAPPAHDSSSAAHMLKQLAG